MRQPGRPPDVVITCDYFPPASRAGGPARTLFAIAQAERDRTRLTVVTRDQDLGEKRPYSRHAVEQIDTSLPDVRIVHLSRRGQLRSMVRCLRLHLRVADLLYLNSLVSPIYSILPIVLLRLGWVSSRPILLAPRGELAPGALAIKATKKRLVLPLLRQALLGLDVTWHASSSREASDIRTFLRDAHQPIVVRANPAPSPDACVSRPGTDCLTIAFVGRMVPIKNFLLLARAAAKLTTPTRIIVAGSLEDEDYWRLCRNAMDDVPRYVSIDVRGHLDDLLVADVLRQSDVLVLPTRGENFGRAIAESLAVGCPVMVPDTTMWTPLIEEGAGWLIDADDPTDLVRHLSELAGTTPEDRFLGRRQAREAYARWWGSSQNHVESLFRLALHPPPAN